MTPRDIEGERDAFLAGAKYWEFYKTGGTMWQSDQTLIYQKAIERYKHSTKAPEPQAGDVDTIRDALNNMIEQAQELNDRMDAEQYTKREAYHKELAEAKIALSHLSAPIDVQAKAEAVVHLFEGYAFLSRPQKYELSRLIVEQFSSKG